MNLIGLQQDLQNDPLSFVHRYQNKKDQEVAAVFASALAYGRVTLFFPVIESLMEESNRWGGPYKWIQAFNKKHAQRIANIYYRLNKAPDFALLAIALQTTLKDQTSLESVFQQGYQESDG